MKLMKNIKYLILILPLLFITNVKAECTNLFNANNISMQNQTFTINSLDSITVNPTSYNYAIIKSSSWGFVADTEYIFSFNYVSTRNQLTDKYFWPNSSSDVLSDDFDNSTKVGFSKSKYVFSSSDLRDPLFALNIFFERGDNTTFSDIKIILASEYDSCVNGSSTPVPTMYTYTFKVDDTTYETGTVEEGSTVSLPETNPTKEGYTFIGWTLNGESYTGGVIHSNIEIIANFEEIVETPLEQENPQNEPTINLSGLIPYLLLIASLIMIIILRDFIKSIFKSRR